MESVTDKIEGPFVIDRDLQVQGMITVAAIVEPANTLHLHGMVTGDLIVKPGATAIVHGMVNGTVHNEGGHVEIYGKADRVADTGSTVTHIDPEAVIGSNLPARDFSRFGR